MAETALVEMGFRPIQKVQRVFFGDKTCQKKRTSYRLRREAEAMTYVRSQTSLPVPCVISIELADLNEDEGVLTMQRMPGVQLGTVWARMTVSAKTRTISELKAHFDELHALRPPKNSPWAIMSCSGGTLYDQRFRGKEAVCGPFRDVREFHEHLMAPLMLHMPAWESRYRSRLPDDDEVGFVHADISDENILVDEATGAVTAILDWEMAGFLPRWWEYRKALHGSREVMWWAELLRQVMVANLDAVMADQDLEMYW